MIFKLMTWLIDCVNLTWIIRSRLTLYLPKLLWDQFGGIFQEYFFLQTHFPLLHFVGNWDFKYVLLTPMCVKTINLNYAKSSAFFHQKSQVRNGIGCIFLILFWRSPWHTLFVPCWLRVVVLWLKAPRWLYLGDWGKRLGRFLKLPWQPRIFSWEVAKGIGKYDGLWYEGSCIVFISV